MRRLLDVNVLIARCDRAHPHHPLAMAAFERAQADGWASCPMTENGLVRVLTSRAYAGGPCTVGQAVELLSALRRTGHRFISDDISVLDSDRFHHDKFQGPGQLTDAYLLALAVKHGMYFATFDSRINPAMISGGAQALEIIPVA